MNQLPERMERILLKCLGLGYVGDPIGLFFVLGVVDEPSDDITLFIVPFTDALLTPLLVDGCGDVVCDEDDDDVDGVIIYFFCDGINFLYSSGVVAAADPFP